MGDIRSVATAISSYGAEYSFVPKRTPGKVDELRPYLAPTYLRVLPGNDGRRRQLTHQGAGLSSTVCSFAGGGLPQASPRLGPTTNISEDIIISNGIFIQWPDGMQTN